MEIPELYTHRSSPHCDHWDRFYGSDAYCVGLGDIYLKTVMDELPTISDLHRMHSQNEKSIRHINFRGYNM